MIKLFHEKLFYWAKIKLLFKYFFQGKEKSAILFPKRKIFLFLIEI